MLHFCVRYSAVSATSEAGPISLSDEIQVMHVLSDLASGDCLVAIISHVEELEKRIEQRIEVKASPNGSSVSVITM